MSLDSFNARNMRVRDVAASFVTSADFVAVQGARHTVILGPRGSGKTTLLKMLTLPAWRDWSTRIGSTESLPFTGVYVPADIHWHHQLVYSSDALSKAPSLYRRLSEAFVTHSVMFALVEAFGSLAATISDSVDCEAQVCSELLNSWKLGKRIPCFLQLQLAIKGRVMELGRILNRSVELGHDDTTGADLPEWCDYAFVTVADHAVTAFDLYYHRDPESRWALCFDELELAPTWLQEQLFKFPRSVSQKLLFKLSSSPDPLITDSGHVTALNDVDVVRLWRASMMDLREFCNEVAKGVIRRKGFLDTTPEALFGSSFDPDFERTEEPVAQYERGSEAWTLLREVSTWDASLRNLLERKGLDPDDPSSEDTTIRDQILRKVRPVAALRKKFAKVGPNGTLVRRTRKTSDGFFGVPAIYDVSDGNPRRLIRLVEELCEVAKRTFFPIAAANQSRAVQGVAYLYQDYLQMLPRSRRFVKEWEQEVDLYSLLREIGRFFSAGLLLGPFPLDPKSSFQVDEHASDDIVDLLRLASYHGAIVKVDSSRTGLVGDIRGRRYRLCYTLSPLLQLPLRLYDSTSLKKCLHRFSEKRASIKLREPAQTIQHQMSLGGLNEG